MSKPFFGFGMGRDPRLPLAILRLAGIVVIGAVLAGAAFSMAAFEAAHAAGPFTVDTTSDSHCTGFVSQGAPGCTQATDSGGHISLRSALEAASAAGGTTNINLPPGTYNLTLGDLVAGTQANTDITIHGMGSAPVTIINQTQVGHRVIVVNYNVAANVVLALDNVTITGGSENENDPDGFGGHGGAILAGGSHTAAGNSLSVTNAIFSGNYCSPASSAGCSGGAINMAGGGDLTVSNSTFSGNDASKNSGFGAGGAIYFDNGGSGGNATITNSTFTNNTAHGNSTTGGQGGAIRLSGGAGTTYTLSNNVFAGNTAAGTAAAGAHGGAIMLIAGGLTADYNRIVGNNSMSGSGLFVAGNSGTIGTATNNWWGCSGGPGAAGCDTAVLGTPNQGGAMTFTPWIVLTNRAGPNPIQVNQTTTLTADFLHNSNGGSVTASQISMLLGLPVTWGSAVKGTLSAAQAIIQADGTATATFTANAAGAGSASAGVDNGAATAGVMINKADTTTTITADDPDPSAPGAAVTVKYAVAAHAPGSGAPTGNVTVSDGVDSCTAIVAAGACNVTLTTSGARMLTATYAGDGNFNASTSAGVSHAVGNTRTTTTTILSDNPDPSVVGQAVTVQYSVTPSSGTGMPAGNVTVSDGAASCTATVAAGQCSLNFTGAGTKSITAVYAGDGTFSGSTSATVSHQVNEVPATLLYNGEQIANAGSTLQAAALLSGSGPACVSSQPIAFTLDRNPTNGVSGSYALGTATTDASGRAKLSLLSTAGWHEGVYTILAAFAGTSNCGASSDFATLTIASPGDLASGGGWYPLGGNGRVNFGFTIRTVRGACTCANTGQLLLISNGKWRLKGTLNSYSKRSTGHGAASGVGDLYWWNSSLNGGVGGWALARTGARFTANFYDGGHTGKASTDTFGIRITYTPVPPQPGTLPNSTPQPLQGGNITVK